MAAFATTADVAARWRPLSTNETTRAAALLAAASLLIRELAPTLDARIVTTPALADVAEDVCCDMVIRVLTAGVDNRRVTVGAITVAPTAVSGPSGLRLTLLELHRLQPMTRGAYSVTIATPDPD